MTTMMGFIACLFAIHNSTESRLLRCLSFMAISVFIALPGAIDEATALFHNLF